MFRFLDSFLVINDDHGKFLLEFAHLVQRTATHFRECLVQFSVYPIVQRNLRRTMVRFCSKMIMAYLHCRTQTRIPTRIRTPHLIATLNWTELFPLHGLGLRFQSRSRPQITTVPIFGTDIRTQFGIRVHAQKCK